MRFHWFHRPSPSLGVLIDYMKAAVSLLNRQEAKLSALSDAVAVLQTDTAALGVAITDVQARVAARPTADDAADVAAAVSALAQAHTDLANSTTALAAIAPAAPAA